MLTDIDHPVCAFRLKPMSPLVATVPAIVAELASGEGGIRTHGAV